MAKSSKGSSFERWVCKTLSLWWTGGKSEDCFWRTSNSGGRATVRGKQGKATRSHYGDVCVTDEEGKPLTDMFTIEIKRGYNRSSPFDLMDKPERAKKQTFAAWVGKAEKTSKEAGSVTWMLITKRDLREPMVFYPAWVTFDQTMGDILYIRLDGKSFYGQTLSQFLASTTPHAVREYLSRRSWD